MSAQLLNKKLGSLLSFYEDLYTQDSESSKILLIALISYGYDQLLDSKLVEFQKLVKFQAAADFDLTVLISYLASNIEEFEYNFGAYFSDYIS